MRKVTVEIKDGSLASHFVKAERHLLKAGYKDQAAALREIAKQIMTSAKADVEPNGEAVVVLVDRILSVAEREKLKTEVAADLPGRSVTVLDGGKTVVTLGKGDVVLSTVPQSLSVNVVSVQGRAVAVATSDQQLEEIKRVIGEIDGFEIALSVPVNPFRDHAGLLPFEVREAAYGMSVHRLPRDKHAMASAVLDLVTGNGVIWAPDWKAALASHQAKTAAAKP